MLSIYIIQKHCQIFSSSRRREVKTVGTAPRAVRILHQPRSLAWQPRPESFAYCTSCHIDRRRALHNSLRGISRNKATINIYFILMCYKISPCGRNDNLIIVQRSPKGDIFTLYRILYDFSSCCFVQGWYGSISIGNLDKRIFLRIEIFRIACT